MTHRDAAPAGRGEPLLQVVGDLAGGGGLVRVEGLTKRYGRVCAVDGISFEARAGRITGFLGPNGAGKTTTLRMILGLTQPTAGRATIAGREYRDLVRPMRAVGAAMDNACFHPGRSARSHLLTLVPCAGADGRRVDEVLDLVGLGPQARRPVGAYSLGMRQRLGLAGALLGDPQVLILDEPTNGLDPQGVVWLRQLLRDLADRGRTVLFSSHALGEVEHIVDDVVIVASGRVVHASTLDELAGHARSSVRVTTPTPERLERVARRHRWAYTQGPNRECIEFDGVDAAQVGRAARFARIEIHEMVRRTRTLEDIFIGLVAQTTAPGSSPREARQSGSHVKEDSDERRLAS
ncbi:MAG: ATP-binding cassette domain-containing protein [Bifidobacteriaceae bacterium]|nr:ATP-binding cassette domain-containing protein [Bifidobacteriaceae bacterium]